MHDRHVFHDYKMDVEDTLSKLTLDEKVELISGMLDSISTFIFLCARS